MQWTPLSSIALSAVDYFGFVVEIGLVLDFDDDRGGRKSLYERSSRLIDSETTTVANHN